VFQHKPILAVVIVLCLPMNPAVAGELDILGPITVSEDERVVRGNDVSFHFPFSLPPVEQLPSFEDLVRVLVKDEESDQVSHVRCELVSFGLEEERVYPIIGAARLCNARLKCTVSWSDSRKADEVSFVIHSHLVMKKRDEDPQRQGDATPSCSPERAAGSSVNREASPPTSQRNVTSAGKRRSRNRHKPSATRTIFPTRPAGRRSIVGSR